MSTTIEITRLSTKGQVVLPASTRKNLDLQIGTKFMILESQGNIVLKPIRAPEPGYVEKLLRAAQASAKKQGLTKKDLENMIKKVRGENSH